MSGSKVTCEEQKNVAAWQLIHEITNPNITPEKVMTTYATWADTYEQDVSLTEYTAPKVATNQLLSVVPGKQAKILDIAAGTGMLGEELVKLGYTNLDALDASEEMLEMAKSKKIYDRCILAYLGPNRLPIADNTYDAITTCGSFVPGHVNHTCFPELIRIVKPGGYIIVLMRESYLTESPYFANFEAAVQQHQDEGSWEMERRRVLKYHAEHPAAVFVCKVLPTKTYKS